MKNKGFTLVELLAVISILAILVIVAMPNVLGMFNEARVNVFVTDVQKIIDVATTAFTKDALSNAGKTVYYSSVDNDDLKTKKLDVSGDKKEYFIEIDRNGEFKRVVVYDNNYCYDIYARGGNVKRIESRSKFIVGKISKTIVNVSDVWESGNDIITTSGSGNDITLKGCEANISFDGINYIDTLPEFEIDGIKYKYAPGRTWEEWINSECNTDNYELGYTLGLNNLVWTSSSDRVIFKNAIVCDESFTCVEEPQVAYNYEIIKGVKYSIMDKMLINGSVGIETGDKYFDLSDNGGVLIYEQEIKVYDRNR